MAAQAIHPEAMLRDEGNCGSPQHSHESTFASREDSDAHVAGEK